ncbi:MAG TPA: hypothetical protein ENN40_04005 [Candidatus Aminicenantes bacterium]|nr:hypothetical protein [Candidatus Aminicenantes bacterium]
MKLHFFLCIPLLVVAIPDLAGADIPRKISDIPTYADAKRDTAAEAEYKAQMEGEEDSESGRSEIIRIYSVASAPEPVARFYIKQLKASAGMPEITEEPAPGTVIAPWYELEFYRPQDFENQYEYDTLIYDGKWVKSCLENREPWSPGQWLGQANLMWEVYTADSERKEYLVGIEDMSVDNQNHTFIPRTRIFIQVVREEE